MNGYKKNHSILIVEDEIITAQNIRLVLENSGYTVDAVVSSGEEAIAAVKASRPDLVLIDIILEGKIDGIEAARRINKLAGVPIIYLTASSDRGTLERAKIAEPYAYILKPFNEYDLCNSIEMALYKNKIQGQILREKEINSKLAGLSQSLLTYPTIDDMADMVLEEARYFTGSDHGFVGYIDPKTGYLIAPTLLKDIWNSCRIEGRSIVFKEFRGLWGWVLNNRKPLLTNNPAQSSFSAGAPEGHIEINNFIGVPALFGDRLLGLIAVANKNENYDGTDLVILERVATIYALGLQQRHLEEERLKLSHAIEQSPGIFVITDLDGNIEYVNGAFTRLTGYSREEIYGKNPRLLKSGTQDPGTYKELWDVIAAGRSWKGEFVNRKKNGEIYWEEASISPIKNQDGFITHFLKVGADITEQKNIRQELETYRTHLEELVEERTAELEKANKKLKAEIAERKKAEAEKLGFLNILEMSHNEIYIFDAGDLCFQYVNSQALNNLGYTREETTQMTPLQLKPVSGTMCYQQGIESLLEDSEQSSIFECRHRRKDGSSYPVDVSLQLVEDNGRKVFLAMVLDITEKKKAEEISRQHEQQLIQADKMVTLGTLVSGVAHEINNPNNFIMMNTPLLRELWEGILPILENYYRSNGDFSIESFDYSELRQTVPELFDGVMEGARRIKNIVKELKDFARQDSPQEDETVDINSVVKSAVTLTSPLIRKYTQRFNVHYQPDIPPFKGKFQQLEQVVINLIQNACQALPSMERGISVTTEFARQEGVIRVKICDEGSGIAPEHLNQVTDPFFTTKRDTGGTGLGLSISSSIVSRHGGRLSFDSHPGRGTEVTVILPHRR